ncbi:MAG: nicotinamide riboside transporter PnuC [Bacteroidetes bacterium]|nr:nicotinamide riboside transporter PnuC [Bacteroidota bacterium]
MTFLEIIATITGIISVWFVVRQNIWCYPFGIISVTIYIYIFFNVKLYADMGLQVAFIILQAYGWYVWLFGGKNKTELIVTYASRSTNVIVIFAVMVSSYSLGKFLKTNTDAALPFWDSTMTSLSLAGQYLMAKKNIENWFYWIVVNIISIGMYIVKDLYVTTILYSVYFVLAIIGLIEWKKEFELINKPLKTETIPT